MNLIEYGLDATMVSGQTSRMIPARVLEANREIFTLICEHGEISARLKGTFYKQLSEDQAMPVVGDFVKIQYNPAGHSLISEVMPRKSIFFRSDLSGHAPGYVKTVKAQVVAVNFDYVFIMVALNHDFNMNRIQRYFSIALQSGALIIDTSGMRELGIFEAEEGLTMAFEDVEAIIENCKYRDCRHDREPGCAVREALENRTLTRERWKLYNQLGSENRWGTAKVARTKKEKLREKIRRH